MPLPQFWLEHRMSSTMSIDIGVTQMSEKTICPASAINISDAPAIVILSKEGYDDIIARVKHLEDTTTNLEALLHEVRSLRDLTKEHEARLEYQSKWIGELRFKEGAEPGPKQRDRREVLKALLLANGGKMSAKEARQKMEMDKATFSRLIAQAEGIEVRPMKTDRRKYLLILKGNG